MGCEHCAEMLAFFYCLQIDKNSTCTVYISLMKYVCIQLQFRSSGDESKVESRTHQYLTLRICTLRAAREARTPGSRLIAMVAVSRLSIACIRIGTAVSLPLCMPQCQFRILLQGGTLLFAQFTIVAHSMVRQIPLQVDN